MKDLIVSVVFVIMSVYFLNAQVTKPRVSSRSAHVNNQQSGIQLPNIDRVKSTDLKKLKIPLVSITEAQKKARAITSWTISPTKPRYSALAVEHYYGEYSLQGWRLEPRPQFEGPDFNGFYASAMHLKFRVSSGTRYTIIIKLKDVGNWYEGKTVLAAAMNNSYARYPIDAHNNEILIPFTANSSGTKRIAIGNVIANNNLFPYTIEKITIHKNE